MPWNKKGKLTPILNFEFIITIVGSWIGFIGSFHFLSRTNKFHLSLILIIVVNHEGKGMIASSAFLAQEDEESFSWVFNSMSDIYGKFHPKVVQHHQN